MPNLMNGRVTLLQLGRRHWHWHWGSPPYESVETPRTRIDSSDAAAYLHVIHAAIMYQAGKSMKACQGADAWRPRAEMNALIRRASPALEHVNSTTQACMHACML